MPIQFSRVQPYPQPKKVLAIGGHGVAAGPTKMFHPPLFGPACFIRVAPWGGDGSTEPDCCRAGAARRWAPDKF